MIIVEWMIPERQLNRKEIEGLIVLLLLILTATLAACNRGNEDAVNRDPVTATPQAENEVTASSAQPRTELVPTWTNTPQSSTPSTPVPSMPVPTNTTTPSPTRSTQEQLSTAKRSLRLQDYADARRQLGLLLVSSDITQEEQLDSLFTLARVEYEDPSSISALDAVDRLLADPATAEVQAISAKAHLLRAEILFSIGKYGDAIIEYWLFLEIYPRLGEIIQPRIAAAYLALGDLDATADAYRRATEAIRENTGLATADDTVAYVLMLESLAQTNSSAGAYPGAVTAYDKILEVAEKPYYRAGIQYRAGQALAAAGDIPGAVERWIAATEEDSAAGAAYSALIELVNRDVAFDLYERGAIDLYAEAWIPAISAYESFLAATSATDSRFPLALLGAGQAYTGSGAHTEAISYFDRVIDEHPQCDCVGEAWLGKAASENALGDEVAARRTYRTFAREQPESPLAPESLWRSALLALNSGNEVEAGLDLLTLAELFPESERAPNALYVVAVGAYKNGLYGQSVSTFERLQRDYPDYRWDAVGYWLGRSLHANGMPLAGSETWQNLIDRAPDIYHGVLAAQGISDPSGQQSSAIDDISAISAGSLSLEGDDGSQAFAEAWLSGWVDENDTEGDLSMLPSHILTETELIGGRMLLDVGERSDGIEQLDRLYRRHRDDPATLYPLILEFERLGAYRLAISAATYLLQSSPAQLLEETPIFLQKFAYPRHFEELVVKEALANDLDPNLFFSLIRQESLFEEGARSSAAAQGLAQIIPDTGSWVATQLGYPNYTNDLVYRPDVNLKFGAYYLAWARDYLDGNLTSALAGYNAGPGNADRWRELSGSDDALFVELFDYNEPRLYIHAILSNLYHYTRLYDGP